MAPIDAVFSRSEAEPSDLHPRNFDFRSLQPRDDASTLSPIEAHDLVKREIIKRDASNFTPGQGARPPTDFNNQAFLAIFATLGAVMVLVSIWFFFWAKNGGFHFQEGDWEDYKSTVLRRKGPDGRTLSNATKSTKLGGSTIAGTQHYKWAKQAARSVVSKDEKGRKGVLGKRGWGKTHSITYSDDFTDTVGTQTVSDMTEIREVPEPEYHHHAKRYRDRDVHEYKKERPARVGGLNRVADGSHIDTSYNGSETYSEGSERPILQKQKKQKVAPAKDKERAERNARVEAAKMERRWKKEAEEAAAALARESARSIPQPKKTASPSRPSTQKQRQPSRSASRSASPKKRDFSYPTGPGSEVLSTAYTGTTGNRSASYYDSYRPRAASNSNPNLRYSTGTVGGGKSTRTPSPKKKATGGYRRGADSDFD